MYYVVIPIKSFKDSYKEYILENINIVEKYAVRAITNSTQSHYAHGLKASITERGNIKIEFSEELVEKWRREYYEATGQSNSSNSDASIANWFSGYINHYLEKEVTHVPYIKEVEELEAIRQEIAGLNMTLKDVLTIIKKENK